MNKYSLHEYLDEKLSAHRSSFKETSLDTENNEYLCTDEAVQPVYNFDAYVGALCKNPNPRVSPRTPASPDAIYVGDKNLYFIEFKNQPRAKIDREKMRSKFENGSVILKELLRDFIPRDCKYFFCVVFRDPPTARYGYQSAIERTGTRLGLDEMNEKLGAFYDDILVEGRGFYIREFAALKCE